MRKLRLKRLSDLFKLACLVKGRARIRCSDSQRTSKKSSTIYGHSLIHPVNEYLLSTYVVTLSCVNLDRRNHISQNSLMFPVRIRHREDSWENRKAEGKLQLFVIHSLC